MKPQENRVEVFRIVTSAFAALLPLVSAGMMEFRDAAANAPFPDKHQLFERGRGPTLHRHSADKGPQRCHPERSEGGQVQKCV